MGDETNIEENNFSELHFDNVMRDTLAYHNDLYSEWEEHIRQLKKRQLINKIVKKQLKNERRKYLKTVNKYLKS